MAQYNAGKNPPWARNPEVTGAGVVAAPPVGLPVAPNNVLTQPHVATPTVYSLSTSQPTIAQHQYTTQQIAVPTIQANTSGPPPNIQSAMQLPQPGIAMPTTLATTQVATISYPAPRPPPTTSAAPQKQQRVFTGTVSKLHDNFGFVDEDVFFQTSCVKGVLPKVGDRVLVEASYNANMPFKWNAARIQVLPNQSGPIPSSQSSFNAMQSAPTFTQPAPSFNQTAPPPPMPYQVKPGLGSAITPSTVQQPPPLMGQPTQPTGPKRDKGLLQGGRSSLVPSRRIENQSFRDRDRTRDRDRSDRHTHDRRERRSPRKRSRSPRRSKSPSLRSRSPQRRRQQTRIVPRYMVQIPKLSLDCKEANVVALKSRYSNLYVPSDFFNASFTWVDGFPMHRPFLLGNPCSFHVMNKEVEAIIKYEHSQEPSDADHLYSAKVMLLSSPPMSEIYHKSCALAEDPADVRDVFQHPTRLVQFLVGVKGKSEMMAIGGPWSESLDGTHPATDPRVLINTAIRTTRLLTGIDLSGCTQWYRFNEIRYHRPEEMHKGRLVPARVETVVIFLPDVWSCNPTHLEWDQLSAAYKRQLEDKLADENKDDTQEEEEDVTEHEADAQNEPTHYSELDPKAMKVADLRKELEARALSSKGLKSQLIARLTKALKSEQEKEELAEDKTDQMEQKVEEEKVLDVEQKDEEQKQKEEEEKRRRLEKERSTRECKYQVPDRPAILVHPSLTAKAGKFDCTVTSLSVLLDYRLEDNKEHSFEVSLFAESFNEMMMRDFGFDILKALTKAPEPKKEEKDDKKETKEKDKEDIKDDKENTKEPSVKKRKISQDVESKKKCDGDKDIEMKEEIHDDELAWDEPLKAEQKKKEHVEETKSDQHEQDDDSIKEKDHDHSRSKEKDKKRDKVKYLTADPHLLLAFIYFDQSHTGYLLDKDVEDILHTLGLQLSRAQVKKLVQKLVSRDTLNYRKLTDKPIKDGEKEETEEGSSQEKVEDSFDIITLAQGNLAYFNAASTDQIENGAGPSPNKCTMSTKGVTSDGLVMYNGAMVDINSVMQRLERSEKNRTTVEFKYKETQEEMDQLKTSFTSSEQNSQKITHELQELKKKLREQKRQTDSGESSMRRVMEVVHRSKGALTGLLNDLKMISDDKDDKPMNGD